MLNDDAMFKARWPAIAGRRREPIGERCGVVRARRDCRMPVVCISGFAVLDGSRVSCVKHSPHSAPSGRTVYLLAPCGPYGRRPAPACRRQSDLSGGFVMSSYLTLSECAERYRVSRWLFSRAVQDGRLSAVRVGSRIRIAPDALESFVNAPSCPIRPR